jgi:hypothetical protein
VLWWVQGSVYGQIVCRSFEEHANKVYDTRVSADLGFIILEAACVS